MAESNDKASRLSAAYEETRLELAKHRALFPEGGGTTDYELTLSAFEHRLSSLTVQMAEHSGNMPAWMKDPTVEGWDKLWEQLQQAKLLGREEDIETIMSEIKMMVPDMDKLTNTGGLD